MQSILRNVYKWGPMTEELNQVINGVVERPVVVVLAGFKVSRDIDGTVQHTDASILHKTVPYLYL